MRIYVVTEETDGNGSHKKWLVKANNQAEAIRVIVSPRFVASVAEPEQLIALTKAGVEVQEAG